MKISEISWKKDLNGKWHFVHWCDNIDRVNLKGLRVAVSVPHRIDGFIKKGLEKEGKALLLKHRREFLLQQIREVKKQLNEINDLINE